MTPSPPSSVAPSSPGLLRRATAGELALVLGLPTALFLGASLAAAARVGGAVAFTDARVLTTLAVEGVLAAGLLPWLRRRGWTPGRVAGAPAPRDAASGFGLWALALLTYWAAYLLFAGLAPDAAHAFAAARFTGALGGATLVLAAVANPLFEEFLWLGYAVPALEPRLRLGAACAISVALRTAVHAYQGTAALVGILPTALVFTAYYARTRRLWPVVVAHVVADAVGLAAFLRTAA